MQSIIILCTTMAEYLVMLEAKGDVKWLQRLFHNLHIYINDVNSIMSAN